MNGVSKATMDLDDGVGGPCSDEKLLPFERTTTLATPPLSKASSTRGSQSLNHTIMTDVVVNNNNNNNNNNDDDDKDDKDDHSAKNGREHEQHQALLPMENVQRNPQEQPSSPRETIRKPKPRKYPKLSPHDRQDSSLTHVTLKLLRYIKSSSTGVIDVNEAIDFLRINQQKIWESLYVMESVGFIKRCSRYVYISTRFVSNNNRTHDDNNDDDRNLFQRKSRHRRYSNDASRENDQQRQRLLDRCRVHKNRSVALREEVQALYHEDALLDIWISRLRRILYGQTNLTCYASDIVQAIFQHCNKENMESSSSARNGDAARSLISKSSSSQPPSRLMYKSNLRDPVTGKVQWSLLAVHAPHGSLVQVVSNRTINSNTHQPPRTSGSDCRILISTKIRPNHESNNHLDVSDVSDAEVDVPNSIQNVSQTPADITNSPIHGTTTTTTTINRNHFNTKSPVVRGTRVIQNDDTAMADGGDMNHVRSLKRPRVMMDDQHQQVQIILLPTIYNTNSNRVELSGSKCIVPDYLVPPTILDSMPPASLQPSMVAGQQHVGKTPAHNGNHNQMSTFGHRKGITGGGGLVGGSSTTAMLESLHSWNFSAELTYREGLSDFFPEPLESTPATKKTYTKKTYKKRVKLAASAR